MVRHSIPLITPEIRGNEWRYVKECLDTGWVSSVGSYVSKFEELVAARSGAKYAIATVSGTAALHMALLLAGVQPDDEVIMSSLTFVAPANATRYIGAWPVFIDAEDDYWQISPAKILEFVEQGCSYDGTILRNQRTGRRISAILPVHILGHPVDLDPILAIANRYSLRVIEDATEGLGACYRGNNVGGGGHIGCFSFNGNKIVTTGGGGMIVTSDADWAARARYLTTQAKDDPVEYIHHEVGYNYRLTNLSAAVGCAQIEQLDSFVAAKRQIAKRYQEELSGIHGLNLPQEADWAMSTCWMYTVLVDRKASRLSSRALMRELAERQIQTRPLWQPMHRSPAHRSARDGDCPIADLLYEQALSLPCSVGLTESAQGYVIESILNLLGRSGRQAVTMARPSGKPLSASSV